MKQHLKNIKIKKAQIKHAGEIALFLRQNFKIHNLKFSNGYVKNSMKGGIWFLAFMGNQVIGAILIKITKQDKRGELKHFIVKENFRRQGAGKALLREAIKLAKRKKLRKITGFATSTNIKALKKLASYFGFKLEGILKNHYRKNENAYVYSLFFQ